ncbi:MaoC family dehydratase [Corynebacterium hansenii]|uniref:MaoC family dehydratase n=1 Tax=Corynebacterium hansenii TaxID=394964 RepID=A0ABV7ZR22_9CORY|nr:MaoC family dehydratase [Corynebacterium hansenii]WJZ01175.1 putative enoyl-CoA hydratase 1 [Corynebacterium hansenii]
MAKNVTISELPQLVGEDLGVSRSVTMSQERINGFAEVTEDRQWIHLDAERAAETPFGGTIAHGFLTLSLASALIFDVIDVEGATVINYGLDKVRFTAPVPSGSDIEMAVKVAEVSECRGGQQVTFDLEFRNPGAERPACIAALVFRYLGEG